MEETEEISVLNLGLLDVSWEYLKIKHSFLGIFWKNSHSPETLPLPFPYLSLWVNLKIVVFLNLELVCNAIVDDGYLFIWLAGWNACPLWLNLLLILGSASLLTMQDLLNTLMKLRDVYHYCLFCGCQVTRAHLSQIELFVLCFACTWHEV